jgi:hypothetical protein
MSTEIYRVRARENSVSGGTGLNTGLTVSPGQILVVSVDPKETWGAGGGDRVSNANGLGNPLGGDFGQYKRGAQSFLYGSLVGSLDGGQTFFGIGTHLVMTVLTSGTLTLHFWDSNNQDNFGRIRVIVSLLP